MRGQNPAGNHAAVALRIPMWGYERLTPHSRACPVPRYESPCGVMSPFLSQSHGSKSSLRIPMWGYEKNGGAGSAYGNAGYESPCGVMSRHSLQLGYFAPSLRIPMWGYENSACAISGSSAFSSESPRRSKLTTPAMAGTASSRPVVIQQTRGAGRIAWPVPRWRVPARRVPRPVAPLAMSVARHP